jgi:hypothetical protein
VQLPLQALLMVEARRGAYSRQTFGAEAGGNERAFARMGDLQ